ncbi:type II toxin-antitoxin system RelE/ParE family toxin [Puniceicoccaceae bacterium K14]|nr:type II toxin-antitoxin system RelE/ParE family toxin [Puniceicoccaceae bacterium K14]
MEVIFSESAKAEARHAASHYEDEVEGLGKTFLAYVEGSIDEIERFPLASRVIGKDFRRFLVPRFPYGIIYRVSQDMIFIAAIMHLKRRPFYWKEE